MEVPLQVHWTHPDSYQWACCACPRFFGSVVREHVCVCVCLCVLWFVYVCKLL